MQSHKLRLQKKTFPTEEEMIDKSDLTNGPARGLTPVAGISHYHDNKKP